MTSAKITHSSIKTVSPGRKAYELTRQCISLVRGRMFSKDVSFSHLASDVSFYDHIARTYAGRALRECRVLEIGFGARPYRLYAMHAAGAQVIGVDLDMPMLRAADAWGIYCRNGLERALKSTVRYMLFDIAENRRLNTFLSNLGGKSFSVPLDRLVVSDASASDFWRTHAGPYDLIFSEDVFEHIPEPDLERLITHMHGSLAPNGVAVISPMIFTGLLGGHLVELYGYQGGNLPAGVPPWDHLRQRTLQANTYLNELPRRRYRELFSNGFEIVAEIEVAPRLGEELATVEIRRELANYDDTELFSNKVSFVLKRSRQRMAHSCEEPVGDESSKEGRDHAGQVAPERHASSESCPTQKSSIIDSASASPSGLQPSTHAGPG